MNLLWPWALLGLAVLAWPLWLHRQRQEEDRRRDFAALRFVLAQSAPRAKPRWRELVLLALRLTLLSLAVLWLAGPWLSVRPAYWPAPPTAHAEAKAAAPSEPLRVSLRRSGAEGEVYLAAVLKAWGGQPEAYRIDDRDAGTPLAEGGDWLFQLGAPPIEDEACRFSRLRLSDAWPDGAATWAPVAGSAGRLRWRQRGCARELALMQPQVPEYFPEVLEPGFPALLRRWLDEGPGLPAARAGDAVVGASLEPLLAGLLILSVGLERFLATRPGRGGQA
ncbi:MAG: BatA domain-containing protein [Gammaproteobacteria bacterium]|nr:BatA domain-containing protein [Gammaproteobacteria bacterium]